MKQIKPAADDIGQRIDRYLRKIFPWARLGEIYEALRTKKITINGKKLPESTRLRTWDSLDVDMPEDVLKSWQHVESSTKYQIPSTKYQKLDVSRILFEDNDLLIYDKPAGLIVHSPDHKTDEVSLIDQVEDYLKEKGWKPAGTFAHPALAHRIDRDTSGIIISCLNRLAYEHMAEQFRTRKVQKTYQALVAWVPEPRKWIITAPLLRIDTGRNDEAKVIVDSTGQSAETSYKTLFSSDSAKFKMQSSKWTIYSKNSDDAPLSRGGIKGGFIESIQNPLWTWSLVELHPKTGRTHQIRVHMAHIGCPLIGDRRYGGPSVTKFPELTWELSVKRWTLNVDSKNDTQTFNIKPLTYNIGSRRGHLLHASKIEFTHPNGREMTIESESGF